MGFFKSIFGGGSKPKSSKPASIPRGGNATFTPVGDAEFTLVSDESPLPIPQTGAEEQSEVEAMLKRAATSQAELDFLGGEVLYVKSSNVHYFQYLFMYPDGTTQEELIVGYLDGSAYLYEDISLDEASAFYHASSPGGEVWNRLRLRGTVFGFQKKYRLIEGTRVWHVAGADSIARHESIPASGETVKGYHPATNYKGVKGPMGTEGGGVNLGKKGSRKVAHFIAKRAKPIFKGRP